MDKEALSLRDSRQVTAPLLPLPVSHLPLLGAQLQLVQLRADHERLLAEHEAALQELAALETRVVRGEFDPNKTKVKRRIGEGMGVRKLSMFEGVAYEDES